MNKKQLIRKIKNNFKHKTVSNFVNPEEIMIIKEMLAINLLNSDAFCPLSDIVRGITNYQQDVNIYPFTKSGKTEFEKNWYIRLRENLLFKISSDIILAISLILGIINLIKEISK